MMILSFSIRDHFDPVNTRKVRLLGENDGSAGAAPIFRRVAVENVEIRKKSGNPENRKSDVNVA